MLPSTATRAGAGPPSRAGSKHLTSPSLNIPRLISSYAPEARAALRLSPAEADDPARICALADLFTDAPQPDQPAADRAAAGLLVSLWASTPPGEKLPRRMLSSIERHGRPLWEACLLLPESQSTGIQPWHYAGACRLSPHLHRWRPATLRPEALSAGLPDLPFSLPPTDARWDARILAERLERDPLPLNREGALWKDAERRLLNMLGAPVSESGRWMLALKVARIGGLLRPVSERLCGQPDARWRGIPDPTELFTEELERAACRLLLRCIGRERIGVEPLLAALAQAPECLRSPGDGSAGSWEEAELPALRLVLSTLLRIGAIEGSLQGDLLLSARLPGSEAKSEPGAEAGAGAGSGAGSEAGSETGSDTGSEAGSEAAGTSRERGAWITPDLELMLPVDGITAAEHARLCRLAPFVGGDRVQRYRLCRAGMDADLRAGHRDAVRFLASIARHPLPPSVRETVQEWERQYSRIRIWTGLTLIEEDGRLRRSGGEGQPQGAVLDYVADPGRVVILAGPDGDVLAVPGGQLPARAAARAVADPLPDAPLHFRPAPRRNAGLHLLRLSRYLAGPLPGAIEARIRSGDPVQAGVHPAWLLKLDPDMLAALQRDPDAGRILRRSIAPGEVLVEESDRAELSGLLAGWGIPLSWG